MRRESSLLHPKISGYNPSQWEVTEAGAGSSRSRVQSRAARGEMNHACAHLLVDAQRCFSTLKQCRLPCLVHAATHSEGPSHIN